MESQVAALIEDGCDLIFKEVISTKVKDVERPELQAALASINENDEIVFCKLDHGFRTQKNVSQ